MKVLVGILLLIPSLAWGRTHCAALLENEFAREPDDARQGLVSDSVPLTIEAITAAYSRGIFPWGVNAGGFGHWHRPPLRGVLDLNDVHIGRSDRKYLKQALEDPELRVTFDQAFPAVMEACATVERFRTDPGTGGKVPDGAWINENFREAYAKLHRAGFAHSVEVWRGDKLVGGLYGVFVNGVFTGESMFHFEADVTKLAFNALIERLRANGHQFIDTQMTLGLAKKWGARLIPRAEFEERLAAAQQQNLKF